MKLVEIWNFLILNDKLDQNVQIFESQRMQNFWQILKIDSILEYQGTVFP